MTHKKTAFVATFINKDGGLSYLVSEFISSDDAVRYFKRTGDYANLKVSKVQSISDFLEGDTWELCAPGFLD